MIKLEKWVVGTPQIYNWLVSTNDSLELEPVSQEAQSCGAELFTCGVCTNSRTPSWHKRVEKDTMHFLKIILLLFNYSCLHSLPPIPPNPSQNNIPPLFQNPLWLFLCALYSCS